MQTKRRTAGSLSIKVAAVVDRERGIKPESNVVEAARAFAR
jgi:hypothetical protein